MNIPFFLLLLCSFALFAYTVRRLITYLALGGPEDRSGRPAERARNVLTVAFGHSKLLREPLAGVLHLFIFWGFLILFLAILEAILVGLFPGFSFSFLGAGYPVLITAEDLFGLLVIGAVLVSIARRTIWVPERLKVDGRARADAMVILCWILLIVLSMIAQHAFERSAAGAPPGSEGPWRGIVFWTHVLLVLGFLNYLPYSKHLHIMASIPNVYFAKLTARGTLAALNLQDESRTTFGVTDVEDLSWKQLLDGYACTECGRCTASCPAAMTGKPLSPRKIITDIRHRLLEKAPLIAGGATLEGKDPRMVEALSRPLLGGSITEEELWACTTCLACVQECPVQIEHVDAIVGLRRSLVLNESRFPKEMQPMFQNLERNYSPWAFAASARADWAAGLGIPLLAEKRSAKVLFWVGCAGSYDARYQKVARAFAELMKVAGVDFAILGAEEKCNGDPARRAGNEYLAQMLISENVKTLNSYGVKTIVTTCPHCFNIMKNEYPALGGNYEVIHHTDFIMGLISSGKIAPGKELREKITYHDSCYLGRYNQLYDPPRNAIAAIPGVELKEMERSRDKGLCCGAGGARMFMEETTGTRVNAERTREALSLKVNTVATACPFCMTMLTDGVKDSESAGNVQVKDIAELVLASLRDESPGS